MVADLLPRSRRTSFRELEASAFVGRRRELAALGRVERESRLVTLVGEAGVGKTRLAQRFAASQHSAYEGVWFCDLRDARDAEAMCAALARALFIADEATVVGDGAVVAAGRALAARGRVLVVESRNVWCVFERSSGTWVLTTTLPHEPSTAITTSGARIAIVTWKHVELLERTSAGWEPTATIEPPDGTLFDAKIAASDRKILVATTDHISFERRLHVYESMRLVEDLALPAGRSARQFAIADDTIVVTDDSLVVELVATKRYAGIAKLVITVTPLSAFSAQGRASHQASKEENHE